VTTFAPRPGAAPVLRQVGAQASMEARLMLRNGEQLLLALVIPVIVLVGGVAGADRVGLDFSRPTVDILTPGVLALAVMSTAFTSLAIATGFERRYGVIKRLGTSPLSRTALLAGKAGALLAVEVVQLAVIGAVGVALGWDPEPDLLAALAAVLLGTLAFASLGLLLAGSLRAEATLAAANLVYLLLLAGGAVVLPAAEYGGFGDVARWLPSGALGEALRDALERAAFSPRDLLVLAGWAVLGGALTSRTFKWE
jgi:ABC-2 type transport system permease protein